MTLKQLNWQLQLTKELLNKSILDNDNETSFRLQRLIAVLKDSVIEYYENNNRREKNNMDKKIVAISTSTFTLELIEKKNVYYIIRETEHSRNESMPMKDLKLALGVFDDFYNELNNALQ